MTDNEQKNWCYAAHLGPLALTWTTGGTLSILAPLIVLLVNKDKNEGVLANARESLNFQLTMLIVSVALAAFAIATFGLGIFLVLPALLAVLVLEVVACIKAAISASRGEVYRYPLSIRFIK